MTQCETIGWPPLASVSLRAFTNIEDVGSSTLPLDTFEYLQKLVLYNSEHPEQIEEEFASHIGLKRKR